MLVLTRKLGENIVIGEHISVKVIFIDRNKVQLGIEAPGTVSIYRQELVDRVKIQNKHSMIKKKVELAETARKLKELWSTKH